jgi:hypothetical protein
LKKKESFCSLCALQEAASMLLNGTYQYFMPRDFLLHLSGMSLYFVA